MATKNKTHYVCTNQECNHTQAKWTGQCPSCKEWNTLEERQVASASAVGVKSSGASSAPINAAQQISKIDYESALHKPTGIGEFDRVLGGGLVPGGVILLAGEPGCGKALSLGTPLPTPHGFTTMKEVKVGDYLLDAQGKPTKVVAVSEIDNNAQCYGVSFSDGSFIIADARHQWVTKLESQSEDDAQVRSTEDIYQHGYATKLHADYTIHTLGRDVLVDTARHIVDIVPVASLPVKCVQVDNDEHLYLAGSKRIPTHNSTLTTTVAGQAARNNIKTLIVSGEETAQQIAKRAARINAISDNLYLASENDLAKVLGHIEQNSPELLIVDSVQTIASAAVESRSGSPAQVTEVATLLTRVAKERNIPMIMIGHVTKEGTIAGPRTVEHLVDVVLHFEGDRDTTLKMLRGVKNRYGASEEIGCFEHTEEGIIEVPDPSGMLLGQRTEPVPGVMTSITVEGKRPLPIEIQALVAPSAIPVPRRATSGLDNARAVMVQAVTERYGNIRLADKDIYLATIGGARTKEPAVDLATVMAIASAADNIPTRHNVVAIGEVALSGEVRRIPGIGRRLVEAARLGFNTGFIPPNTRSEVPESLLRTGFNVIEISHVGRAIEAVRSWR